MEIRLVCGTKYLNIDNSISDYVFEVFNLSNDKELPKKLFGLKEFVPVVGYISFEKLINSPVFIAVGEANEFYHADINTESKLVAYKLTILQLFISCFWFVKDCCSNTDVLYLYNTENKNIKSELKTTFFSNAKGEYSTSDFKLDELHEAENIFFKLYPFLAHKVDEFADQLEIVKNGEWIKISEVNKLAYNEWNRIEKAFNFLIIARSNSFLPLKISFYVVIYETLFTTDNTEVSHKVSERISFYLGNNNAEKEEIFKLVKNAYAIRSKYIHGQRLDKKLQSVEKQIDLSVEIDSLTRRLLRKIILEDSSIFTQNENDLNDFFNSLL